MSTHTSLPTLFEAATQVMTSTEADERVLGLLGLPETYLADQGIRPDIHWADLVLQTTPYMSEAERASHHDDDHELHTKIVPGSRPLMFERGKHFSDYVDCGSSAES